MSKEKFFQIHEQMDEDLKSTKASLSKNKIFYQSRIFISSDSLNIIIDFKENDIGLNNFNNIYNFLNVNKEHSYLYEGSIFYNKLLVETIEIDKIKFIVIKKNKYEIFIPYNSFILEILNYIEDIEDNKDCLYISKKINNNINI